MLNVIPDFFFFFFNRSNRNYVGYASLGTPVRRQRHAAEAGSLVVLVNYVNACDAVILRDQPCGTLSTNIFFFF